MGIESPTSAPTSEEAFEDAKTHFTELPTIDELYAYFIEVGLELDPELHSFYYQLLVNHFRIKATANIA